MPHLGIVRELGPVLTALLVGGRVASGITAELGSMRVTDQIDAMRAMATDPYKKLVLTRIIALLVMLPLAAPAQTTVKVLFDATKAETAGGADWILDADAPCSGRVSFPQQLPTPDQATITDTDTESAWSGAFSNWGIDLVQRRFTPGHAFEYVVETLPADGAITFGDGDNPQDLANYDILILAEPNSLFTTAEKNAIAAFVQNGGGLFLIADHAGDDRNNDGWDCPEVLNDLEATLGLGIHFQELGEANNTVSQDPATAFMTDWSTESPILNGPFGSASTSRGFAFHGSTTMVLDTGVNPTWTWSAGARPFRGWRNSWRRGRLRGGRWWPWSRGGWRLRRGTWGSGRIGTAPSWR